MIRGIIPKLSPWKEGMPFARLLMSKATKILFKVVIDYLRLAIGLRVVSGAHLQLGAWHFEELFLEIADKYGIAVTNDGLRHAMKLNHTINTFFQPPLLLYMDGKEP